MCSSAESSLAVGVALVPAGVFALASARKHPSYLPVAGIPLLFGAQQLCEAAVWLGVARHDPGVTEAGAIGFLFFAVAFWPAWVPLAAAPLDT